MKQTLLYYLYLQFILLFSANAQTQKAAVEIQILNNQGNTKAATIHIFQLQDTVAIKSGVADPSGFFSVVLESGKYAFQVSAVGFRTLIDSFEVRSTPVQKKIILIPDQQQLGTVTISAKKTIIERSNNKIIVNVEQSSIATGSTALEILAKIPGVSVDQNGNISVKGNSGVQVLIDGKSTYLSAEQLATRLRALNSNEIKSIELINNPSAKYDADGHSGLINIKLKKNTAFGTNGNLDAGFGYGKNPKSDAGISLNHRTSKINAFGSYSNNNNKLGEDLNIYRIGNPAQDLYFHQTNTQVRSAHNNSYKAGLDYFIDEKNTIGILASGYFNHGHENSMGRTNIGQHFNLVDSAVRSDNPSSNRYRNQAYNLNYKSVMDTLGKEFSVDLDYAKYLNEEYTIYNNFFESASAQQTRLPAVFRNQSPSKIQIWAAKVDYSYPINPKTKLDLGIKSSWVHTDNDFRFENLENDQWINDAKRSNRFIYSENINAAYALFKGNFEFADFEIGLRAEQTNSKGNSIQEEKIVKRSYFNLFPSLSINKELSENHEIGLSFSRRIDRPDYKSLNPFVYFVDLYTYSQGSPFLNPQYSNGLQLSYTYLKKLNIALSYSKTKDLIMDVFLTNQQALYQTSQNLASQSALDLTIGLPVKLCSFWSMDNNLVTNYNKTVSSNLNGVDYNRSKINMMFNSNHTFTISPTASAELTGEYASAQIYGTYAIKPYYGIDLGFKKSILAQKLNFKFALNDVLNSRRARISSALSNLNYDLTQKLESRIFRLSVNYVFGSSTVKSSRDRKTSVSEEENRIK